MKKKKSTSIISDSFIFFYLWWDLKMKNVYVFCWIYKIYVY